MKKVLTQIIRVISLILIKVLFNVILFVFLFILLIEIIKHMHLNEPVFICIITLIYCCISTIVFSISNDCINEFLGFND